MKTQTNSLLLGFRISIFGFLAAAAFGQTPVISQFGSGQLTFTNITSNLEYRLQWSSSPTGSNPYNENFNNIQYIAPTGTSVTVPLPLSFHVGTTNALSNNIFRAHEHPFGIPMGTNAKATVEWSENYGGPWSVTWNTPIEETPTGSVANASTPHFYRITFINCPSNFAGCGSVSNWVDATDPSAPHGLPYGSGKYYQKCMRIRVGQAVTFSNIPPGASFVGYPLRPGCQDYDNGGITNLDFGQIASFIFTEPGYFGYYAQGFGDINGNGMSGNIQVVP